MDNDILNEPRSLPIENSVSGTINQLEKCLESLKTIQNGDSVLGMINPNAYSKMMEELGKKFFTITKINQKYSEIMSNIRKQIDKDNPNISAEEKEKLSYRCFYDRLVYGCLLSERRMFDFEHKSHEEKDSYVTYWKLVDYYNALNKRNGINIFINKHNQCKLLKQYFKRDVIPLSDESDFDDFCQFVRKHPVFLVKNSSGSLGVGVAKKSIDDYKSYRDIFNELLGRKRVLTLEEIIEQSDEMALLHPQSVNTIRITTVRINDRIHIFYPFLKAGSGDSIVDNGGSGGYLAGINPDSGVVDTNFFDEFDHYINSIEYHPDTNVKIKGFKIPKWNEACSLAIEVAEQVANRIGLNYVGWDLAFTSKGWVIVEGNAGGFLLAPQMVYQKPLRWEFEKLINWKSR